MRDKAACTKIAPGEHVRSLVSILCLLSISACTGEIADTDRPDPFNPPDPEEVEPPPFDPAPATLHRLTRAEYLSTLGDLMPEGTPMPTDIEVDTPLHGFTTIGSSELTLSALAVEQYETAARLVTGHVFGDPARREAFVGCAPSAECNAEYLGRFARRAWRRPPDPTEVAGLVELAATITTRLADPWRGLEFATSAILQSPHFLFRVEIGEPSPDRPQFRRYTSHEMASRLSYFLWGTTPDETLLADADAGALVTDAGIRRATERMLEDPRAAGGLERFFGEYVHLGRLQTVSKDPDLYPQLTATLRDSMRQEVVRLFSDIALSDADFRRIFDTDSTVLEPELAAHYGVDPATTELPAEQRRGGLLGRAGMMTLFSHATVTSPTVRGRFVRIDLLCEDIPPPPPGVDTSLPEADPSVPRTLRERLAEHRSNAVCAGCHDKMDPIGFAFEGFGALGEARDNDEGLPIDTETHLDGVPVADAQDLGIALATDPRVAACFARRAFRYATGHLEIETEEIAVRELADAFASDEFRFRALILTLVTSDAFRLAASELEDICPRGESRSCDTACGAGTQNCAAGGWSACSAPAPTAETCDGSDEDCDGSIDEELTRACDGACGGVETCAGGSWGACETRAAGAEMCSGVDDDCDGVVDEGFHAEALTSSFTALSGRHPGCDGAGQRRGPECNAAISRLCADSSCHTSGFGPLENSGDRADIACVAANVVAVPWTALSAIHAPCDGVGQVVGIQCNSAIHRWCAGNGFASGFGPVERGAGQAHVACVSSAEVRSITYADVAAHHAGCSSGGPSPDCDAAIHRYCRAQGFVTGFGPVESSGANLAVTCVLP